MADYIGEFFGDDKSTDKVRKIYPRMTLKEYEALDESVRGELIGGRFYAMAGASTAHQSISFHLAFELEKYIRDNKGDCRVFIPPLDVKLFKKEDTILQPDVLVVCDPKKIGEKRVDGAPDLVIEVVSPANPGHDYIRKLELYLKAGVREYWIVDPEEKRVVVYIPGTGEDRDLSGRIYRFDQDIPVFIYKGELTINLKQFA